MKPKSFDRREELLEAAMAEFSVKSYEDASLNNIIKNAGISKGTFYYHFRDKQDLYLNLLQMLIDTKMEFMQRRLRDYVHNEDLNFFENIKLQASFAKELAKEKQRYYLLGMMFQREKGTAIYETAMNMFGDTTEAYMDNMMNKAVERGDFREGVSLDFIKKTMAFLMYRSDEIIDVRRKDIDLDHILNEFDELIDFMQFGFGKRE
jgi:AcrR family transcriptional regulator